MTSILRILLFLTIPLLGFAQSSISINSSKNKTKIQVSKNGSKFSLEYEGEVELTDDDTDVLSVSEGGFMEIKKSAFGSRRRIFIEPGGGRLIKKYYVGSKETPFDPEGKKWLAEILLEVVRTSTLGAVKRVDRLYSNGGVHGVIDEIGEIESDHVKAQYFRLLGEKELSTDELVSVLAATKDVSSDHHKADILKGNIHGNLTDDAAMMAFIDATGAISSDHHKADILKQLVKSSDISETELKSFFNITKNISSDHHKADIMMEVMKNKPMNDNYINLLLEASDNIDSDHHKANILMEALNLSNLTNQGKEKLLNSISKINSDHHKANILGKMLSKQLSDDELFRILDITHLNLHSDHHKSEVVRTMIKRQNLNESLNFQIVDSILGINSSRLQTELLKELARQNLSENELINLIQATPHIDSDHATSDVLLSLSSKVRRGSDALKEAYRDASKSLSSHSQENILNAIK